MSRRWRRVIGAQRCFRMLSGCGVAVLALATGCTTGLDRRRVEMLTCAGHLIGQTTATLFDIFNPARS